MLYLVIINLIKRYFLTRAKPTALYKHLITKTTLTYISADKTVCVSDSLSPFFFWGGGGGGAGGGVVVGLQLRL